MTSAGNVNINVNDTHDHVHVPLPDIQPPASPTPAQLHEPSAPSLAILSESPQATAQQVPSLSLPTLITAPTLITPISHRYTEDRIVPSRGQLIKIRLQDPLKGPGSKISSSAPSRATQHNYHHAVVIAILSIKNAGILISVLPIPSYSQAEDAVQWVLGLPPNEFRKHIPMPCPTPESSSSPQPSTTPTPEEFGPPINPMTTLNGQPALFINRVPSWVFLDQQTFFLPLRTRWKSFSPNVFFPSTELDRLQNYMITSQAADILDNLVDIPDPSTDMLEQVLGTTMGSGSGIYGLLDRRVYVLEDDGLEDDEDDDIESECDPVAYYRMLPNKSPWMQKFIDQREREERVFREERILDWMDKADQYTRAPIQFT